MSDYVNKIRKNEDEYLLYDSRISANISGADANKILTVNSTGEIVASTAPDTGVTSFNGRSGAVNPQSGDYTPAMVGALASDGTATNASKLENHSASYFATDGNLTAATGRISALETQITGLSGAMHFIGIKTTLPTSANNGDVCIVGNKEYVWSEGDWHEFGDTSDYVLKSQATGYDDILTKTAAGTTYLGKSATAADSSKLGGVAASNYVQSSALSGYVPTSRTVNSKALTGNISLTASDVGADASGTASSAVSGHNASSTAHSDIRTAVSTAQSTADTANTTANAALPKAGGTISGNLTVNGSTSFASRPTVGGTGVALTSEISSAREVTVTLSGSGWSGSAAPYTQTISASGVTASTIGVFGLALSATQEQYEAAASAQLRLTAQGSNTITVSAYGEAPTVNIPCVIQILG